MNFFVPSGLPEKYFAEISVLPRLSGEEQEAARFVCEQARRLGLPFHQDAAGNVIVQKPASPGMEDRAPVLLHAHLDMPDVRQPHSPHDFSRDPLLLVDDAGHIRAQDTALGADSGFGCAYLLALMEEETPHPPLEMIFTVQAENGRRGARALDCTPLRARRMIGLDATGEKTENACVTAAFAEDGMTLTRDCQRENASGDLLTASLTGMQSSPDGVLPHPEAGSAVKLTARLLSRAQEEGISYRLVSMEGNETDCRFSLVTRHADRMAQALRQELALAEKELQADGQNLRLDMMVTQAGEMQPLTRQESQTLTDLMFLLPSGSMAFSPRNGRLLTACNGTEASLRDGHFSLKLNSRALNDSCRSVLRRRVEALADLCGCDCRTEVRCAAWPHRADSPLLQTTAALMRELYGGDMEEKTWPGSLECCELLAKMPGLEIVIFGPVGGGRRSASEWMDRASFGRVYAFLEALLQRL